MNVKIMGADQSVTNNNGSNWKDAKQCSAARSRLYKLSITNLSGTDYYVWIFDLAAGSAASAAPVHVRFVPQGYADTWDFSADGSLFQNGIYLGVAAAAPSAITTTLTTAGVAGDDKMILKADIRVG